MANKHSTEIGARRTLCSVSSTPVLGRGEGEPRARGLSSGGRFHRRLRRSRPYCCRPRSRRSVHTDAQDRVMPKRGPPPSASARFTTHPMPVPAGPGTSIQRRSGACSQCPPCLDILLRLIRRRRNAQITIGTRQRSSEAEVSLAAQKHRGRGGGGDVRRWRWGRRRAASEKPTVRSCGPGRKPRGPDSCGLADSAGGARRLEPERTSRGRDTQRDVHVCRLLRRAGPPQCCRPIAESAPSLGL
jgi:hypothetical protein